MTPIAESNRAKWERESSSWRSDIHATTHAHGRVPAVGNVGVPNRPFAGGRGGKERPRAGRRATGPRGAAPLHRGNQTHQTYTSALAPVPVDLSRNQLPVHAVNPDRLTRGRAPAT